MSYPRRTGRFHQSSQKLSLFNLPHFQSSLSPKWRDTACTLAPSHMWHCRYAADKGGSRGKAAIGLWQSLQSSEGMYPAESWCWWGKTGKELHPASAPQMQFHQKETASHKLFQYPEQSDKQWDSEHKHKEPGEQVKLSVMANSSTKARKIQGKCCLSRTGEIASDVKS